MNNPVLEVKNLTKKFGDFVAVNNISFSLGDGEILGLLGPNGAGKTTTIQMLLGVMDPTIGEINYFGKSFFKNRSEILKQINFSSTYISLPWHFTLSEILNIFAMLYEVPDRKKRIQKLLAEFDLEGMEQKKFFMLSAGERTRALLTKAFLNYPKIILLDEPTASLDVEVAAKVREFLKKERKEYNVSMLFTSHNMSEVEEMCDRVIILRNGTVIAEDSPENLAKKITHCQVELVIVKDAKKASALFEGKKFIFKQERFNYKLTMYEKDIASFFILLAENKIAYQEIAINKPTLEDFFLEAVKGEGHD